MNSSLPVIFLAFANEYQEGRYLQKLVEEHRQLYEALSSISSNENPDAAKNVLCELVVRQNATIRDIFDVFQKYGDRIAIFHYGGHADGYQLLLQGKDGENKIAHAGGLISLLGRRKGLKLVFLNGCSTQKFAQDLVARGVPTVIGTATSIPDSTALQLSSRFYHGLARGLTLSGAWEEAKAEAITGAEGTDTHRGFNLRTPETGRFPWDVEFKDDAAKEIFNGWNLPGVANKPLYGLPEPPKRPLPTSPFLFLKPYTEEHAEIFFGRSYYIRDLYLKISAPTSPPIILLYGESGAGKSSLLDAGLQPRLQAATNPDTGAPLFDVRYHRRDQDLGLVGTLAEMLSYYKDTAENPEQEEAGEAVEDPNLEKIQAIESIAKELEEDTASSFLNLIDRYRAMKTLKSGQEFRHNLYRTGDLDHQAGGQLRETWLSIEKKTGRPLVIILDQVEELFTRPNQKMDRELEDLLQVLYEIFGTPGEDPEEQIKGKIILGYREEFNAKIEARIKEYGLSRSTVFLEQLNKKDILDIFQGLESGVVRDHYNISIEDGLPEHVANQLLLGKESVAPGQRPVAPVLQLLLTKLWNKTYRENSHQPAFTIDAFNEVESQGKEMEEYFETQMRKVQEWNPEVVTTGLALDILAFHITDLGTSKRCHIDDIRARYRHLPEEYKDQPDIVDQLVNCLKSSEIFLLNDIGRYYTSLPHDTLAPVIMREYHRSDKLGQRSARILDTKRPDFIRALHTKEEKKVRLDDNDLEVVSGGIKGMRALEDEEKTLLQISLEEREKRLRLRRILIRGGIVTGLFISFLAVMAGMLSVSVVEQLKTVVVDRAHLESVKQQESAGIGTPLALGEGIENSQMAQLAKFAYFGKGKDRRLDIVHNFYHLAAPQAEPGKPPFSLFLQPGASVVSLEYNPQNGLVAALGKGDSIAYWPAKEGFEKKMLSYGWDLEKYNDLISDGNAQVNIMRQASFAAGGKEIQMLLRKDVHPLYDMAGQLVPAPTLEVSNVTTFDQTFITHIGYYDLFSGEFVDDNGIRYSLEEFRKTYQSLDLYIEETWVDPDSLFSIRLWDEKNGNFQDTVFQQIKDRGWKIAGSTTLDFILESSWKKDAAAYVPLRPTKNLARGTDNLCLVWDARDAGDPSAALDAAGKYFTKRPLDFLYAIAIDSFLTVSTEGRVDIKDREDSLLVNLLPAGKGLLDMGVSPDQRHIMAITRDSVWIWKMDGALATAYPQRNVSGHAFSPDGAHLFTLSYDTIRVWSAGSTEVRGYQKESDDHFIAFARFNEDPQHLIIGLDPKNDPEQEGRLSRFFRKKSAGPRIDYWNMETGKVEHTFEAPGAHLLDATVSPDANFAVAIEPDQARIIPSSLLRIRDWEYNDEGIKALPGKKGEKASTQKIFLSPGGKYIVRQSPTDDRIELFDRKGKLVDSYRFERYSQGINGVLFTPDDYFLMTKNKSELFFWHPEDGSIPWPSIYELSLDDKQKFELTTFFDYIPGAKDQAKWWALGLLIVALIYSLFFFSNGIIHFVQRKDYLSLGLYGGAFVLLTLILAGAWVAGAEDADLKKLAFYSLICSNLGFLGLGIFRSVKDRKYQTLALLGGVALVLAFGLVKFIVFEIGNSGHFEWPLIPAIILLAIFIGVVVYPIFRALAKFHQDKRLSFYRWLYLPTGFAAVCFWIIVAILDDYYGTTTTDLLNIVSGVSLAGIFARKSWVYFRRRRFTSLTVFGIFSLSVFSVLSLHSLWVLLAMAVVYIYGRQAHREEAHGKSFLFLGGSIFLAAGGVFRSIISNEYLILLGVVALVPALILVYFGIWRQLKKLPERKAAGKNRLLNWGAIAGLVLLGWAAATALASEMDMAGTYDDYEDYSYEYEEDQDTSGLLTQVMASYPVWVSEYSDVNGQSSFVLVEEGYCLEIKNDQVVAEFQVVDSTSEYVDIYDESRQMTVRIEGRESFFQVEGDGEWYKLFDGAWYYPEAGEETGTGDAGSQQEPAVDPEPPTPDGQLISGLFDPDEAVRDKSRKQLASGWADDPEFVPALVQYSYDHPDMNEGLWNALYLLETMPDEQLHQHRALVSEFLDWMSKKGYGPSTMERIGVLQDRVAG
ncbi:MAG: CHAT domain-containing protein [Lewinellaceae bacterium]|nr:CHAT domain-containing protein [Lewinellaceae bacterium]